MKQQGVPVDEATAKDFMMVRAALVRRLGGANEALVWTRIDYRANSAKEAHSTDDGTHWWAATRSEIAEETGLTAEQVRRALEKLVAGGFVRAEQHHGFARTMSYAPVFSHRAKSPHGETARSKRRDRPIEAARSPDALLIETEDIKTLESPPAEPTVSEYFEQFYFAYPRKVGREAARKAFEKAAKKTAPTALVDAARRYAADPNLPEKQFIPHPSTWLNDGRWDDEAEPERVSAGAQRALSTDDFDAGDEWAAFNR